jgi:UDPglucose 6-dehydrogenase
MKPDRIVVGTSSEKVKKVFDQLYAPFVRQGNPIIYMDERSAELTKYAANSYLAMRISFMNEIANLCESVGADVDSIRKGIGTDSRIGKRFLFPGIGYGGSCFPKDIKALIKIAESHDYEFHILNSIELTNERQKYIICEKISRYYNGNIKNKKFALWGLAFKPETDDIREAPSLNIIRTLTKAGAEITAFDPEAVNNVKKLKDININYSKDQYEALQDVDALIIATEWSSFRSPDFDKMRSAMNTPVIFDGRNLYDIEFMKDKDFYYESIGRAIVNNIAKSNLNLISSNV